MCGYKKNPNRIDVSTVLDDDLIKRWKAITKQSNRRPADAIKLLLTTLDEFPRGKQLLEAGGYYNEIKRDQI